MGRQNKEVGPHKPVEYSYLQEIGGKATIKNSCVYIYEEKQEPLDETLISQVVPIQRKIKVYCNGCNRDTFICERRSEDET